MWIYAHPVVMLFAFSPALALNIKPYVCSISPFPFRFHENFNLISSAPFIGSLWSNEGKAAVETMPCSPKSEVCREVEAAAFSARLQGSNDKVMRLLPSTLPKTPCAAEEKTDEPELANKVKKQSGERLVRRETHNRTRPCSHPRPCPTHK